MAKGLEGAVLGDVGEKNTYSVSRKGKKRKNKTNKTNQNQKPLKKKKEKRTKRLLLFIASPEEWRNYVG